MVEVPEAGHLAPPAQTATTSDGRLELRGRDVSRGFRQRAGLLLTRGRGG